MWAVLLAAALASNAPLPLDLSPAALAGLPPAHGAWLTHGEPLTCDGAWLADIAARAGLPVGAAVRGGALRQLIVAEAADGYRAVFSLGEIERTLGNAPVLVASACNGKPLDAADGPYRLLAIGDARGARSVRRLVRLRFLLLP